MPVSTNVLPASGPSPGGGPSSSKPQAERAQVVDQRAHLRVGELVVDQLGDASARCPGVSAICSGVAASSASIVRKLLRRGCGR